MESVSDLKKGVGLFDTDAARRHALLTCHQMRLAEDLSCARGSHTFFDLMKVAGRAVAQTLMSRHDRRRVLVLCGTGNNGGDGYVAAETLRQAGWDVRVGALGAPQTSEAIQAAALWQGDVHDLEPSLLSEADLVIDALFGTGLVRPLTDRAAAMVQAVNERALPVIAADLPSGIDGDTGAILGVAIRADTTVTFGWKKCGHMLLPALNYCGEVVVADTGMHADIPEQIESLASYENNKKLWAHLPGRYAIDGHKYKRGHAMVVGGAEMTGAARLAARAAQRAGAGVVSLAVPDSAFSIYAGACESIIVRKCDRGLDLKNIMADSRIDSVGIGMGFGVESSRIILLEKLLAEKRPCVLDADALTLISMESNRFLGLLHENCVLTPHSGEFDRLFGAFVGKSDPKMAKTAYVARKFGCVVLHKGADTVIASPDGVTVVNGNAPPWLATAGSGDVLAGLITGLMAGGMPAFPAACAGASLHGEAGRVCGPYLIAEDLIDRLPSLMASMAGG